MAPRFALFEQIGQLESVTIITERDTDQSKGCVFVDMGDEDAEQVIAQLNGTEVGVHSLTVNAARPREERSGGRRHDGHRDELDMWAMHKSALQTRGECSHLQRRFAAEDSRAGSRRVQTPSTQEKHVMAVRLFIGNLPYDVTEAELRAHFAAVGPLASLALPTDRDTGRPRGFAFVEFRERADAEEAIRHLHNQAFKGRPLAVSEARARDDRTTTGPPRTAAP